MFFVMVLNSTSNNMLSCTDNSRIEDGQIEFSLQNNVKMSNEDFESDFNNTIKKVKEFFWNKISTKITSIEVKRNDFCVESYTLY